MSKKVDETENNAGQENFVELLKDKVEKLRVRLLDLTRRNPLINLRLGPKSASFVRVVDELPDVLLNRLLAEKAMRVVALPPLEEEPQDEKTNEFRNALRNARLVDKTYLTQIQEFDSDSPHSIDQEGIIERDLRDRVREELGMSPRQTKIETCLSQHAKNNNISPSYDLPKPEEAIEGGRHTDDDIQTLFLPEQLERKINGISTKCRTWIQESGINVLHVAFGFLEWKEPNSDVKLFSPLILLLVKLESKRTRKGLEFWIKGTGDGDAAETNFILAEKLKRDLGIELPTYKGEPVEDYFASITSKKNTNANIRIRRQIVIGVFPSSRMAMYYDLDTSQPKLLQNNIIQTMFLGSAEGSATPLADEYEVDEPEVEQKVPYLVKEADASQFSTIVDIADGKNVAVEGPPGTGKSQTIVNAIAGAIAAGKKVLFIAEKMAALNVVKARLEAVRLGEFVLPLQVEHSTKQQVIQSIRDRMEMEIENEDRDFEVKSNNFKSYRAELGEYVSVIGKKYGNSGYTIHEIIWKDIATQDTLRDLPLELQRVDFERIEEKSFVDLRGISDAATSLAKASETLENAGGYWQGLTIKSIDRFVVEKICETADAAVNAFQSVTDLKQALEDLGLEHIQSHAELELLKSCLDCVEIPDTRPDADLVERLFDVNAVESIDQFLSDCDAYRVQIKKLGRTIESPSDPNCGERLSEIERICNTNGFSTLNVEQIRDQQNKNNALLEASIKLSEILRPFLDAFPECRKFLIQDLRYAAEIVKGTNDIALRLRNEATAAPDAAIVIQNARALCDRLKNSAKELGKRVSLKSEVDPRSIRCIAAQIANSGMLSFLSSSYRSAKNEYMGLSYSERFDKASAVSDLRALADWQEEKNAIFEPAALNQILGSQNLGIETDFTAFEKLLNFYEAVEKKILGVDKLEIRQLLKKGNLELLSSIPNELNTDGW